MNIQFVKYLRSLWHGEENAERIIRAYDECFSTQPGQTVLEHLVNNVYATVYEGDDPIGLAAHNGRRSVVQDILLNIEAAKNREANEVKVETKDPERKAA